MLALLALCTVGLKLDKDDKGISIITSDTFDAAVQEHSNIYVEFYAPWCGACAAFAPVYGFAEAQRAKAGLKDVVYAKVDASNKTDPTSVALRQTYGVMGYPTLIHFLDGVPATYVEKGMNDVQATDLTEYGMRFLGGASRPWKEIDDAASIEDFFNSDGAKQHAAVGAFFPDLNGHAAMAFKTMCRWATEAGEPLKCGITKNAKVAKALGLKPPAVAVFKGGPKGFRIDGAASTVGSAHPQLDVPVERDVPGGGKEKVWDTPSMNLRRLMAPIGWEVDATERKEKKYLEAARKAMKVAGPHLKGFPIKLFVALDNNASEDSVNNVQKLLREVHKRFNDKVFGLVVRDKPGGAFMGYAPDFHINKGDSPALFIFDTTKPGAVKRYLRKGAEMQSLSETLKWLQSVLDGKEERFFSGEAVVDDAEHAVKTIVAQNFNERLERADVDTFVLLHKPGTTPAWVDAELAAAAKKFAGVDTVQFAKFNVEKNEIPMSHAWASKHTIDKKKLPYGWFWPASEEKKSDPSTYWA